MPDVGLSEDPRKGSPRHLRRWPHQRIDGPGTQLDAHGQQSLQEVEPELRRESHRPALKVEVAFLLPPNRVRSSAIPKNGEVTQDR